MDLPVPERWEDARATLLPVVRRATEPAHAWAAERADPKNRMVRASFAPHLREMVVLDLPDVRMFVNQVHLERWGVTEQDALAAARLNLTAIATEGLCYRENWGLWQLDAQDGYESSRLALPRWLRAFDDPFEGPPIAAVPVQRALLVGDSADPTAVDLLFDLAARAFRQGANPLSPVLYTADPDGRPVPWQPEPNHPLAWRAAFAERLLATWEYSEQAAQLADEATEAIAPIRLERSGEQSLTVCELTERPALIPEVDQVLLDGKTLDFADLLASGTLEPTEYDPPRWRIRDS